MRIRRRNMDMEMELEAKRKGHDAWCPCQVSLRSQEVYRKSLVIHFHGYNDDPYNDITSEIDAMSRLRGRSLQLQRGQCLQVQAMDIVLASRKVAPGDLQFFDACIIKVHRHSHSVNVSCKCTLDVCWLDSAMRGKIENIKASGIRLLSKESIHQHPVVSEWLKSEQLAENQSLSLASVLSSPLEDSDIEDAFDYQARIDEEIEKLAIMTDKFPENNIFGDDADKGPVTVTRNRRRKSNVQSSSCNQDFLCSSDLEQETVHEATPISALPPSKRQRLSPLAARAALAAAVQKLPKVKLQNGDVAQSLLANLQSAPSYKMITTVPYKCNESPIKLSQNANSINAEKLNDTLLESTCMKLLGDGKTVPNSKLSQHANGKSDQKPKATVLLEKTTCMKLLGDRKTVPNKLNGTPIELSQHDNSKSDLKPKDKILRGKTACMTLPQDGKWYRKDANDDTCQSSKREQGQNKTRTDAFRAVIVIGVKNDSNPNQNKIQEESRTATKILNSKINPEISTHACGVRFSTRLRNTKNLLLPKDGHHHAVKQRIDSESVFCIGNSQKVFFASSQNTVQVDQKLTRTLLEEANGSKIGYTDLRKNAEEVAEKSKECPTIQSPKKLNGSDLTVSFNSMLGTNTHPTEALMYNCTWINEEKGIDLIVELALGDGHRQQKDAEFERRKTSCDEYNNEEKANSRKEVVKVARKAIDLASTQLETMDTASGIRSRRLTNTQRTAQCSSARASQRKIKRKCNEKSNSYDSTILKQLQDNRYEA